jgi:DUF2911 family protein
MSTRKILTLSIVAALAVGVAAFVAHSQDKSKRPSPPAQAKVDLGSGTTITLDYSSPKVKGRKIFGGLVPYGKAWRTGANEATTFVTTGIIIVGGKSVPAGNYTLYTIPEESKWTLVISKKTGEWGTQLPPAEDDVARADLKVSKLPALAEDFKISFDKTATGATMNFDWENTRASADVAAK